MVNNYLTRSLTNRNSTGSTHLHLQKKGSKDERKTPGQAKKLRDGAKSARSSSGLSNSSCSDDASPKAKKTFNRASNLTKKVEQLRENSSTENLKESLRVKKNEVSGFL